MHRRRKLTAVLITALYLSASLFLELGHTDIINVSFATLHRLYSHDCAGKERHRPLDKWDQCPVCARISQTPAYVVPNHFLPRQSFEIIGVCFSSHSIVRAERSILVVRGPPVLFT